MKQFLEITYDEKIESEDTPADDIEGELFKFIPPDYTKSSTAFDATVEADTERFKPCGEKIASHTRAASTAKGKGKANGAESAAPAEDDDDAVVFEVYHVRSLEAGEEGRADIAVNVGHAWVPGVPPPHADIHPPFHRGRELHPGG